MLPLALAAIAERAGILLHPYADLGERIQQRGRRGVYTYLLVALRQYRGRPAVALIWSGCCAVCGRPFNTAGDPRRRRLARTCKHHRGTLAPRRPEAAHV